MIANLNDSVVFFYLNLNAHEALMQLSQIIQEQRFNRSSFLIALDLITASNGVVFNPDYVSLSTPIELDQRPEILDDPNTCIGVLTDPQVDERFAKETKFMYRRLSLDMIETSDTVHVLVENYPVDLHDILDQINIQLDVQFEPDDVDDFEITESGQFTIKAGAKSKAWVGSIQASVTQTNEPVYLFAISDLSGFE